MSATPTTENTAAQRLLETFVRFRRQGWPQNSFEGTTHNEILLLATIGKISSETGAGLKVSDISNVLNVAPPTVTQQLNSLEARGLIERQMDSEDRRVVRVTLSPAGHEITLKTRQAFITAISGLVEYLGEEDSNRLADLLQKSFDYFHQTHANYPKQPR